MDHDLKQRLVGVVVITALAAIFVPMLFDDPVQNQGRLINELQIPDPPVEHFSEISEKLPESADQVLALPEPPLLHTERPTENSGNETGLVRWIIQVGSFSQRKNALELQKKLRKQGFATFLDSLGTEKNGKLYRLKVGPELNKERAEAIKSQLEKQYQLQAILVEE
jgi:DedD protein